MFAELCGDPGVICQVQADQVGQLRVGTCAVDVFVESLLCPTPKEPKNAERQDGSEPRLQLGTAVPGTEGEITQ